MKISNLEVKSTKKQFNTRQTLRNLSGGKFEITRTIKLNWINENDLTAQLYSALSKLDQLEIDNARVRSARAWKCVSDKITNLRFKVNAINKAFIYFYGYRLQENFKYTY
tara:strand:+ start:141 stop:470 length:330 start_codon:yes stop_codon:yes gene_type:complete